MRVYHRRGYLVIASGVPIVLGSFVTIWTGPNWTGTLPGTWRAYAETTWDDINEQCKIAWPDWPPPPKHDRLFYRCKTDAALLQEFTNATEFLSGSQNLEPELVSISQRLKALQSNPEPALELFAQ